MMYGHEHRDRYNGFEKVLKQTDTVSRQAAFDAVCSALRTWSDMPGWRDDKIAEVLINLPPAQEIIYCEDCKYWNSGSCECPEYVVNCQDYWVGDIETDAKHFCGYGKRKEVII